MREKDAVLENLFKEILPWTKEAFCNQQGRVKEIFNQLIKKNMQNAFKILS
jgi:hypothetical protein